MHNVLIVSHDEKLKKIIGQNLADFDYTSIYSDKIFQGLKFLVHDEFDIIIFDVESYDLDVNYCLNIAKKLNKEIHLVLLIDPREFVFLKNFAMTNIDYLQFKPLEFNQLKFHLNCLINNNLKNEQTNHKINIRSHSKVAVL